MKNWLDKLWIVIEGGDIFEGSIDQFKDCFFSNASPDTIFQWCAGEGFVGIIVSARVLNEESRDLLVY